MDSRNGAGKPWWIHDAVFAWLRLARVFQKISTRSERHFRAHNLTTAQFDVVAHVGASRGISQQELANALLVTKGNISQLLSRLERRGLIERRHDGRTNLLALTDSGQEIFDQAVPDQETHIAVLLSPLSEDEQRELLRLLRKLDRAITVDC
jgi:DNA-binding MarR family transcriptional regulator